MVLLDAPPLGCPTQAPSPPASGVRRTKTSDPSWIDLLARAAASLVPVQLGGETGVGKSLFARRICDDGPRAGGPFVAHNCAATYAGLAESTFLGHERGAFTGADATQPGVFERAQGGTLFLDEIGELGLELQGKLLSVLTERSFVRVGGRAPIATDARVIVATNRDLRREVAAGHFRKDLFYRLNVVEIVVPPLRERASELAGIARACLAKHRPGATLTADGLALLASYRWPGNIRELDFVLCRAALFADDGLVDAALLDSVGGLDWGESDALGAAAGELARGIVPGVAAGEVAAAFDAVKAERAAGRAIPSAFELLERRVYEEAMRRGGGQLKRAAEESGVDRRVLGRMKKKFGR